MARLMFRRKRLPPQHEAAHRAFEAVLAEIEPAKRTLSDCMPSTRLPGRPLTDALADYESHLARAGELMAAWRSPEVEPEWRACVAGIDAALDLAQRLREEAPDLGGFEGLLAVVERLMDPLDPFEAAARRFRGLRS